MIKLVSEKFTGIYKKRLSFKWNEFRVYFGFDLIFFLDSHIELDPITTYWSMPHACALKPHPHLPCDPSDSTRVLLFSLLSLNRWLKFHSTFVLRLMPFLHLFFSFLILSLSFSFFFSLLPPFAFFLLSFFRSFCSFRFLFAARGWRTLRAHSKCFPLAERAHCTPILSWQIFWDRGIFRDLEIMIILCYCWVEWKGNFFLAFMASPSFFLSNSKLFSVIIFRFLKFEVTVTRIFIILILLNYINL